MFDRIITVFGGTGFLGRRVALHLIKRGFVARIASRHPERSPPFSMRAHSVFADIDDDASVASALAGAYGAVNAVSLYVERGTRTFNAVHVEGAGRVACLARDAGVRCLAHVSGIGADPKSRSLYVRKRGEGEMAVRAEFPKAILMRPAVMFGPDDAFLNSIVSLLRLLPVYPLFGRGETRLQPVYVEDVAEALGRALEAAELSDRVYEAYELGGPRIYAYEELLRSVAQRLNKRPVLVPVPFPAWHVLARVAELLPRPPLTRNQVELMEVDTIASPNRLDFDSVGIIPRFLEPILRVLVGLECTSGSTEVFTQSG